MASNPSAAPLPDVRAHRRNRTPTTSPSQPPSFPALPLHLRHPFPMPLLLSGARKCRALRGAPCISITEGRVQHCQAAQLINHTHHTVSPTTTVSLHPLKAPHSLQHGHCSPSFSTSHTQVSSHSLSFLVQPTSAPTMARTTLGFRAHCPLPTAVTAAPPLHYHWPPSPSPSPLLQCGKRRFLTSPVARG